MEGRGALTAFLANFSNVYLYFWWFYFVLYTFFHKYLSNLNQLITYFNIIMRVCCDKMVKNEISVKIMSLYSLLKEYGIFYSSSIIFFKQYPFDINNKRYGFCSSIRYRFFYFNKLSIYAIFSHFLMFKNVINKKNYAPKPKIIFLNLKPSMRTTFWKLFDQIFV